MFDALRERKGTIAGGLAATGLLALAAFFAESRSIDADRIRLVNEQIDRAEERLSSIRTEIIAASAFVAETNPGVADMQDFLPRLTPSRTTQAVWLWSRFASAGEVNALENDVRYHTGNTKFTVHPRPAGGSQIAPVVLSIGPVPSRILGFDLLSSVKLSDAVKTAEVNPRPVGLLSTFEGAPLLQRTLFLGALVAPRFAGGDTQPPRSIVIRALTAGDFSKILQLASSQSFALSEKMPSGEKRVLFAPAHEVSVRSGAAKEIRFGRRILLLTVEKPASGGSPRNWIFIALAGLLATGLVAVLRAGRAVGTRANFLSNTLDTILSQLREVRSKELAFFENSGTANCEIDAATGKLVRVNDSMCRLLGYTREELVGRTFVDITYPDDLDASREALVDPSGEPRDLVQLEKRYARKDGTPVWCLVTARLIRDQDRHPLCYATVIVDISKRKQEEEIAAVLTRELAHRVRNTVQLTSSLARQTMNSARSVGDFDAKFQRRLNALNAAQDLLFDSNWKSAALGELATRSLSPFKPENGSGQRLTIDLPNIELPTQHAQTLAIALHELASNSARYGALAGGGKVALSGTEEVDGNSGGKVLYLKWEEQGTRPVRKPRKKGFGLTMLQVAVPGQFSGRASCTWSPPGLVYEAWLPLDGLHHSS
jgi:PAS domain S-box-containing protein